MEVIERTQSGLVLLQPRVFRDERGFFMETYHATRYRDAGIGSAFVQDNLSFSKKGVLRGLHFQNPHGQGKLVHVLQGEVFDVAVDVRVGSPTFGEWKSFHLSSENMRQLWVPAGFAHGFCVLSEVALFAYKCTDFYVTTAERSLRWDDPDIGIQWPEKSPVLSDKDANAPRLTEIADVLLPSYGGGGVGGAAVLRPAFIHGDTA